MMKWMWHKKTNCIIFWLFDYYSSCLYPINLKVLQLFFKRHLCSIDKSNLSDKCSTQLSIIALFWQNCWCRKSRLDSSIKKCWNVCDAWKQIELYSDYLITTAHVIIPSTWKYCNFSLSVICALLINLLFCQLFYSAVNDCMILAGLFM
jgi:hypothetical protein